MKNVIFPYKDYKNDIFRGDGLYINFVFFGGIKFIPLEKTSTPSAFISFQAVDENNKIITISFSIQYDDVEEYNKAYENYCDLPLIGTSGSLQIPNVMPVSCFYKEKDTTSEWFTMYAKHISNSDNVVYKLYLARNCFYTIMNVLDKFRNNDDVDYNLGSEFNDIINSDTKVAKITADHGVIIEAVYINPPTLLDSKSSALPVLVIKDSHNNKYRLYWSPVFFNKKDFKKYNKLKYYTNEVDFIECTKTLDDMNEYVVNVVLPIEFSLTADSPMSQISLICSNHNSVVILDMATETYKGILKSISNFLVN